MSDIILSLKQLDIAYGDIRVIHNFSLDVKAGEFVSLLGPSGCGKTTILRTIAGFIGAANGSIHLDGRDVTNEPAERRDVGIVFQNYALFPTMSAFENIAFGLRVAKTPENEIKARVEDIAEASGISAQLQKKPSEMSGGQQQRVAIARALITGAKVLLFDEPLSNLDSKVRVAMRREIKRLQSEFGFTAFFVTHDQEEAMSLSDRVLVLRDGITEQIGSGKDLYANPANSFVCEFIGDSNRISHHLVERLTGNKFDGSVYVRPEDISISTASDIGEKATISLIEHLGAQVHLECALQGETLHASLFGYDLPAQLKVGDEVRISVRNNSWHQFSDNLK